MIEHYVLYRDVEGRDPRPSFTMMIPPQPGRSLVRNQIIPAWGSFKPLYIQWHQEVSNTETLHLLTYTHGALTAGEIKALLGQAHQFVQQQSH